MEKSIQICYARKEGLGTGGLLYEKQEDYIHKNLERYIYDYVEHVNGRIPLHIKQFERKYKYSTLKYFHEEFGINDVSEVLI